MVHCAQEHYPCGANILLWGTQFGDEKRDISKEPRLISPSPNQPLGLGGSYYYLRGDQLETSLVQRFGRTWEGTVPLKLFIEDEPTHQKHTVRGLLSITVTDGVDRIDTQNLGIADGW